MDNSIYKIGFTGLFYFVLVTNSNAADFSEYKQIAQSTISEVSSGTVSNKRIDKLIKNQEKLIKIGVSAMSEYIDKNPSSGEALKLVQSKAGTMQNLTLSEIEQQWHEGGYLKSKGIDVDKILGQKSAAGSLMDTVVHPATVIIVLEEYRKKHNKKHLLQVKDELDEVIHHLDQIN